MRENDAVNVGRLEGERLPIQLPERFESLKESAIDENRVLARLE